VELLRVLLGASLTCATAWAMGRVLLARGCVALRREEEPVLAFLCGAPLLSLAVFALAALHLAYPAVFGAFAGLAICAGLRSRPERTPSEPMQLRWFALLPFAAFFVLYLANALAPETSADGSAYHLGLVARYLREHALVPVRDNMYASLSQGLEMLFLFAFAFGKHSAAALVHLAFLPALAWSMWCYGRRAGFPVPAACAALLVFASPVVGIDASSAYNDVALAAVAFALFQVLDLWDHDRRSGLLVAAGLLAGFAYAIKYTGALATPYAVGFVLWRARRLRPAVVVGACAALLIAPWIIRNTLWVANPLAPFFNELFPNPYITVAFEREYREHLSLYELKSRWQIPFDVTTRGTLSGLLGPVFLLTPIALLALRRREGRRLLAAALLFSATYFSNIGTRFLLPSLPFFALALMLALARPAALAVGVAALHAVLSWPAIVPLYCHPYAWRFDRIPWREALRLRDGEGYLNRRLLHYGMARLIDRATPPGATIFTFTPLPEAYTSRHIRVAYQSAANKMAGSLLWTPVAPEYAPTWRLRFSFPRQPLAALRVAQTGAGTRDLWSIHELRIYDGARELDRAPDWRLTARPNPWTIQDAFDNSLLTFWMASDWIRPGQYVQVEFARPTPADALVIETAPDQNGVRLKLEGRTAAGQWVGLAAAPAIAQGPFPLHLRRAAAEELKRRGIDYLVVVDSEFVADDLRRNMDLWGVRLVGEHEQARLYQLP
jgi:hypothetical protein